jgi:rhodanese-related sulfurtransferase
MSKEIDVNEIDKIDNPYIIDIREENEIKDTGTMKDAINIPMMKLQTKISELPKDREIYLLCRSGARSRMAAGFLNAFGFNAISLMVE